MSDREYDDAIHAPRIWHAGNAPRGWAEEHRFAPYVRADLVPTWQPIETAPKDASPMSEEIDMSDAADARRFRWLLNGNGYFFEEAAMTGNQHGDWRRMRQAVDDAMKAEEPPHE